MIVQHFFAAGPGLQTVAKKDKWKFSRRSFLMASGAAVAAGAASNFLLAGCQPDVEEPVVDDPPDEPPVDVAFELKSVEPEITATKFNFCGICSANCGMIVDVADDKAWRIRGNPACQVAEGHLCVKGYSALKDLYDPDRLKHPMKRTNPEKGPGVDPGWVKIDWDEAFELTAEAFNQAIEEGGPQALGFFSRGHDWMNRLRDAIGTPNHIQHHSTCFTTYTAVWRAAVGTGNRPFMLDVGRAKYLLSFGWDQPSKAKNMSAREYVKAVSNGAKVVYVDPRLTITGSLGGEWIPIKPGTDLAFMLAMIRTIINEELYDQDFVDNNTTGLEQLRDAVQDYTPEWASEITEVPAETIERVAREFATTKPALIPNHKRDAGGPNYQNSWRVAFCTVILNSLVGAMDREGGQIIGRTASMPGFNDVFPPPDFPELATTERVDGFEKHPIIGPTRRGDFSTFPEAQLAGEPYRLKAALFRKHNVLAFPNAPRFVEALKTMDFVAVVDVWPSEMVQMADVVFPEPYYLETSGFGDRVYHAFYPQLALREPVVDPLYDTRGYGGVITGLANAMGYGEYFEGVSGGTFNDERLKALGSSWEELQNSENGMWSDEKPFQGREEWGTESGKIELYSPVLENNNYDPLPYWEPKKAEPTDEYPFYMIISRPPMHKMSQTQNNELMMQAQGTNKLIINAQTAADLGIEDGDEVVVESQANQVTLQAEVIQGIRPDCVCVEHGFGHWSRELTVAFNQGANEGDLIPTLTVEEMVNSKCPGAGSQMQDFCVNVYKA